MSGAARLTGCALAVTLAAVMFGACTAPHGGGTGEASHTADPTPSLLKDHGNENFAYGNFVTFTDSGFQPHTLLAPFDTPIVWRNATSGPVTIRFDNFGESISSGPIPPGGTWSFNPHSEMSLAYHSVRGGHRYAAFVQTQLQGNSGP